MKINQLASKPKLISLVIDDEQTLKEYGESIEFYTWDRQPLETFMKLANTGQNDAQAIIEIVRTLILDEEGRQVISNDSMLPTPVLLKIIQKIVETLGK